MSMTHSKMKADQVAYYLSGTRASGEFETARPVWFKTEAHRGGSCPWGIQDGRVWEGEDDEQAFISLASGWEPGRRFPLSRNHASESRVALHDFTFSPPKSVSVAWALADDQTARLIEVVHEQAVRAALLIVAQSSICRLGRAGVNKQPAELMGVLFGHGESRSLDPNLHVHAVVMNMTPRTSTSSAALELRRALANSGVAACHYNAELAIQLADMGFEVIPTRQGGSFELAHVSAQVRDMFSTRRASIENMVKVSSTGGAHVPHSFKASRARYQRATWVTRPEKEHWPQQVLKARWRERARQIGYDFSELFVQQRRRRGQAARLGFMELQERARQDLHRALACRDWIKETEAEVAVLKSLVALSSAAEARQIFINLKEELLSHHSVHETEARWWEPKRWVLDQCTLAALSRPSDTQSANRRAETPPRG